MAIFNGVNHLAMATDDMDKTIRLWRGLLRMRLVARLGRRGYRHCFFQISDSDLLAFSEWPGIDPMPAKEHGKPVRGAFIFDHGFIHSVYAHDPDGIPIEFSSNVESVDIRMNPQMKDESLSAGATERAEPISGKCPAVRTHTDKSMCMIYSGAGSELFHEKNNP